MSDYYTSTGYPAFSANGDSSSARSEFAAIQAAFSKLPNLTGNPLKIVRVNAAGTALESVFLSSAEVAALVNDETGSGLLVFATSPTLTTPNIGAATAASVNKVAITAPATGATLTIADGATLTVGSSASVSGTNSGNETATSLGALIHGATNKVTPVAADEFSIWDSVSGLLQRVSFTNLAAAIGGTYAALAGSASQVFSAAAAAAAANVLRADQLKSGLTSVTATVATGKLTLGLQPCVLDFRNSTLSNGAPNTRFISAPITLATDNNGASFGLVTAVQGRLAILAIDNGGTIVLGVVNTAGGATLSEEGVLASTTAITGAVVSVSTVYTTAALGAGAYPYRVVGAVDITWTTGSGYVTTPANVINAGGMALDSLGSEWAGTTLQAQVGRSIGTTYYNATGKRIFVNITAYPAGANASLQLSINGGTARAIMDESSANTYSNGSFILPPYSSARLVNGAGSWTLSNWTEQS